MDIDFIELDSSLISGVWYDQDREQLWIRFRSDGSKWVYSDVGADVYDDLMRAESVGRYFLSLIKPRYVGARMMV